MCLSSVQSWIKKQDMMKADTKKTRKWQDGKINKKPKTAGHRHKMEKLLYSKELIIIKIQILTEIVRKCQELTGPEQTSYWYTVTGMVMKWEAWSSGGNWTSQFHVKPSQKSFEFDSTAGVYPVGGGSLSLPIPTVYLAAPWVRSKWRDGGGWLIVKDLE